MDFEQVSSLRERHPAWRLLRRDHAPLILSFLGSYYLEGGRGAQSAHEVAGALEDHLYTLNAPYPEAPPFPRTAEEYLEDWASAESGWLRRFYPAGSDELHYDAAPALEKAHSWISSLQVRPFVATESRLQTAVDLLRQITLGTEDDPQVRLAELRRRREEIDREIQQIEKDPQSGLLDPTSVRDRYQQFASTARELLSDFREVEENFRRLDRTAREKIATWGGSKGELLEELVRTRSNITTTDQGRSFQAFYDLLLSQTRQNELSELLARVYELDEVEPDQRLRTIHHDWADAAERTQQTVRQISEQLRRFLDDQIWVENRRVLELVRSIETAALSIRQNAGVLEPNMGLEVDDQGIGIDMIMERPLFRLQPEADVDSAVEVAHAQDISTAALVSQTFVDQGKLAQQLRAVVPPGASVLLEDVIQMYPVQQGAAEILGYLSLKDEDIDVVIEDEGDTVIEYQEAGEPRRARLSRVVVKRR